MSDDLIERLRAYRPATEWGDPVQHVICDEAVAELSRLRAEVERLRGVLRKRTEEADSADERAYKAESALADERRHADALAEWAAEYRQAIIAVDGGGDFAEKVGRVNQAAEWLDDLLSAHRARRQG